MKGFLISFFFNLIFSTELLILAVIALLLHIFLSLPIVIFYVLLGVWILIALLVTVGLGVLSKDTPPPPYQKNINPYSKSTKDVIAGFKNNKSDDSSI